MRVVVTGGLGFIGSAVVRHLLTGTDHEVLNLDDGRYASSHQSVTAVAGSAHYDHAAIDIVDRAAVAEAFTAFEPDAVVNLAAETHVDRSIDDPAAFVETNVVGTFSLLEAARDRWSALSPTGRDRFRFVQVSTDEVFGSLGPDDPPFTPASPYRPRSPYAASKAGADQLVAAWHHTYGLPVVVTCGSNTYGPFQFPEKLIPLMIARAIRLRTLPVYGRGDQIRDWLHVDDHARAVVAVLERAEPGSRFTVGGSNERTNLDVVETLCSLLDERRPGGAPHRRLIDFVADRPGHDRRYALDSSEIRWRLGWEPTTPFAEGLAETVDWYLDNQAWLHSVLGDRYDLERLGDTGP